MHPLVRLTTQTIDRHSQESHDEFTHRHERRPGAQPRQRDSGAHGGFQRAILTPDDPGDAETRKTGNAMMDRRLGMILRCTRTVDVVRALSFARRRRTEGW